MPPRAGLGEDTSQGPGRKQMVHLEESLKRVEPAKNRSAQGLHGVGSASDF